MTVLIVIAIILFAVALDVIGSAVFRRAVRPVRIPRAMRAPEPPFGVFVDDGHAWLKLDENGTMRVGVDDFLAEALGEARAVVLPAPGQTVVRGEPLLRVEVAGRQLVVPAPASGQIVAVNGDLAASPSLLAHDPYGLGWAATLRAQDDKAALAPLRIGEGAVEFLHHELRRLLDLLTLDARPEAGAPLLLADGGTPLHGALATCSDEVFARFQRELLGAATERNVP